MVACLLATLFVIAPPADVNAQALNGTVVREAWGRTSGFNATAKTWKFRQSVAGNDLGSAAAAAPSLDDSTWANVNLRWQTFPGPNVANHFRKDFTLEELGIEPFQVVGIRSSIQYDDTAVMYLNGTEIYRSIRGNLDPDYAQYPPNANIPHDVYIPYGGFEEFFVQIPDSNNTNDCEFSGPSCSDSPYGGPSTPEIPVTLLNDTGVNTFAITTWNRTAGGSNDSSLNHTFELLIDENAIPPNSIFINEVMASNETVPITINGVVSTPDWFELHNTATNPVNLLNWTVADSEATWTFPSVTVPANGYLLVAANGVDSASSDVLQTNFKIGKTGDTLRLTNADGFVADEILTLPPQFDDTSYGRPNDLGDQAYLAAPTPGTTNSAAGTAFAPVVRPFLNRIYNVGDTIDHQIDAFDPDGSPLSYFLSAVPGSPFPPPTFLSIDATGRITGTATAAAGTYASRITVTDNGVQPQVVDVEWTVIGPPVGSSSPLVLNEYNAVASVREFIGESATPGNGNGGDWYEFVVVEDNLDLRGYVIQLFDNKGDQLRRPASTVRFGDDPRIANAPAGTIITISEEQLTDLNFDGVTDWHINFQISPTATGPFFTGGGTFNSTRVGQAVLVRDAAGNVVVPLSGETEAWDDANGGVSGGEVMSLCTSPTPGFVLDPIADYSDNGAFSSFGQPNTCVIADPQDPNGTVTFEQNLTALRQTATFNAGSGDTDCNLILDVGDALTTAQFSVGVRLDSGPCFFDMGGPNFSMDAGAADIDADGIVTVGDSLVIAKCSVGIPLQWCPPNG